MKHVSLFWDRFGKLQDGDCDCARCENRRLLSGLALCAAVGVVSAAIVYAAWVVL